MNDQQVEVEVTDESDGTVYVFRGDDQAHVDELIERWSDNAEQTWSDRRRGVEDAGFDLDDTSAT